MIYHNLNENKILNRTVVWVFLTVLVLDRDFVIPVAKYFGEFNSPITGHSGLQIPNECKKYTDDTNFAHRSGNPTEEVIKLFVLNSVGVHFSDLFLFYLTFRQFVCEIS